MRSDSRWFRLCGLSNLKLDSGYKLCYNHVQSESIFWVWLSVSDRFTISFHFISFLVLLQPDMTYSFPTKDFSRASPDTAMLFSPFRCTHLPPPDPTLSFHAERNHYWNSISAI